MKNESARFARQDVMGIGTGIVLADAIRKHVWTRGSHEGREGGELEERTTEPLFILACGIGELGRTRIHLMDLRKKKVWFSNIEVAGA